MRTLALIAAFMILAGRTGTAAEDMTSALADLGHAWAKVYYLTPEDQQEAQFPALTARITAIAGQYPTAAEPLIWKAIVFSSYAKAKGGLGALDLAETARDAATAAAKLDDQALDAGAYTALGALYYKVPGWPIGFGNNRLAREYLERARAIAPDAADVNYFTGDFLLEQGDNKGARGFLQKALKAPARPGREDEDAGRRREIEADLARLAN
jgi:tetratricopeptide (TPR) repeat protein